MPRPGPGDYAEFCAKYVDLVPEADVLPAMAGQLDHLLAFLRAVPEADAGVLHEPYTWTFKQVVGHVADGERVFGYRALRFARGDVTPLPSFDETLFAQHADHDRRPWGDVIEEWAAARRANLALFRNLPDAAWQRDGIAADNRITVTALAYVIVGHARHHAAILRKRLM
jgi:hypothetical protein